MFLTGWLTGYADMAIIVFLVLVAGGIVLAFLRGWKSDG